MKRTECQFMDENWQTEKLNFCISVDLQNRARLTWDYKALINQHGTEFIVRSIVQVNASMQFISRLNCSQDFDYLCLVFDIYVDLDQAILSKLFSSDNSVERQHLISVKMNRVLTITIFVSAMVATGLISSPNLLLVLRVWVQTDDIIYSLRGRL